MFGKMAQSGIIFEMVRVHGSGRFARKGGDLMVQYWRSVSISKELYERLQNEALEKKMSLRQYVHYLLVGKELDEYLKKKLGIVC
jgi:hypothetical protein